MSKIFYIMGKSSSGKDTIYKKIREKLPQLKRITPYTTRPIGKGRPMVWNIFLWTKKG